MPIQPHSISPAPAVFIPGNLQSTTSPSSFTASPSALSPHTPAPNMVTLSSVSAIPFHCHSSPSAMKQSRACSSCNTATATLCHNPCISAHHRSSSHLPCISILPPSCHISLATFHPLLFSSAASRRICASSCAHLSGISTNVGTSRPSSLRTACVAHSSTYNLLLSAHHHSPSHPSVFSK